MKKNILGCLCAFILCLLFLQAKSMEKPEKVSASRPQMSRELEKVYSRLRYALNTGKTELARNIVNQSYGHCRYPLHRSVEEGCDEIVKELLNAGAEVNIKNFADETPLHVAARLGKETIVRLLVSSHADIMCQRFDGRTPLDVAIKNGHKAVVQILLEVKQKKGEHLHGEKYIKIAPPAFLQKDLLALLGHGDVGNLMLACQQGVNVNVTDPNNLTALEIAAHHPDPAVAHEMVRILLPYVINPNPVDSKSEQLLDQIMHQMGRRSIAQLIVEELTRRGQVPMLVFHGFFMDQPGISDYYEKINEKRTL